MILCKTFCGILISATQVSSKKIFHVETVKQFLFLYILQWGLGGINTLGPMKNVCTPAPASHERSCWLPLPACLQGWQGAEANRKLYQTSPVWLAERDTITCLEVSSLCLPSFWLSYKPPSYQEKGQILWTWPKTPTGSWLSSGYDFAQNSAQKIINGPQGTLVHVSSPCSPAANDSMGWHSAKVVLPSSKNQH